MKTKDFDKEEIAEFLKQLSKLTRRYKIKIGGCGCCVSPYVCRVKGEGKYDISETWDELHWVETHEL